MSGFSDSLKALRNNKNITQSELAQALGISRSTIAMYEAGEREPDFATLQHLATFFQCSMGDLLGQETRFPTSFPNLQPLATQQLPLLQGKKEEAVPHSFPLSPAWNLHPDYALEVLDSSMEGARICKGDLVFLQQTPHLTTGDIVALPLEGQLVLRRLFCAGEQMLLQTEPSSHPPLLYSKEELPPIFGKVIAFQSRTI